MWFYKIERDDKHRQINVTWNTTMTYLKNAIGFIGVSACIFNFVWVAAVCLVLLAVSLTYYTMKYGDLVRVLHDHEKKETLTYTGSRYSFKDPLVVTIPQVRRV